MEDDKNISFIISALEDSGKGNEEHDNLESICHNMIPPDKYNNQRYIHNQIEKPSAVWTTDSTLTLLKLYEDKLQMLETPKKKTRIWRAITESLKQYDIDMTPNQVRWKINALTKKYKQCIDSGIHNKFKYFNVMGNIYSQYNVDNDAYIIAELLENQKNTESNQINRKITLKPIRENKAMLEFRKTRLSNRIQCDKYQSKIHLEKQWLQYVRRHQDERASKDEMFERSLKLKEEKLEIHKRAIEINNTFELHDMEMWKRKHETLISNELKKIDMLKKILRV